MRSQRYTPKIDGVAVGKQAAVDQNALSANQFTLFNSGIRDSATAQLLAVAFNAQKQARDTLFAHLDGNNAVLNAVSSAPAPR